MTPDERIKRLVGMCSNLIASIPHKGGSICDVYLFPDRIALTDVLDGKVSENEVLGIVARRALTAANGSGSPVISCRVVDGFIEVG